ncbi:MAG: class I SAM-dependent methyltransferase [Candidatus Eremiobacteraeota bacterium]|nr:class I SAM-dependent methyltransferase [Candidatus Eremiobacteraeota bacterium]
MQAAMDMAIVGRTRARLASAASSIAGIVRARPKDGSASDFILRFCTDVLHLESLHFGMWQEHHEPTLAGLREAQKDYTSFLIARIPAGVRSILDSGCGTGELSERLIDADYAVTAIAPDSYLSKIVRRKMRGRGTFVSTKFEEFATPERFDLIVMSESCQYLSRHLAFPKARELLAEGGHLLVSAYFRKRPTNYYGTVWVESRFLENAAKSGFDVVSCDDITQAALPTLDLGHRFHTEIFLPTIELVRDLAVAFCPPLVTKAVTFAFRKQLALLTEFLYVKQFEQFDSRRFAEHVAYKVLLLRKA